MTGSGVLDTAFHSGTAFTFGFATGASDTLNSLLLQSNGAIIAAGTTSNGTNSQYATARLVSAGNLDSSFSSDGLATFDYEGGTIDATGSSALLSSGQIVLLGARTSSTSSVKAVIKISTNGDVDSTFGVSGRLDVDLFDPDLLLPSGANSSAGGSGTALGIFALSNGSVVIGGQLDTFWNADGNANNGRETNGHGVSLAKINQAPTATSLTSTSIAENNLVNAVIGTFSSVDPDPGDSFTYSLVSGTGSTDNGAFTVTGNQLKANSPFDFEIKNSYSILVRTSDAGGLTFDRVFTITITGLLTTIDLATLTASQGTAIYGAEAGDVSGFSVSDAGDVNGDGFNDVLIGARNGAASMNSKLNAGEAYVIFGAASLPPTIDLGNLGSAGITIFGADIGDQSGRSVSSAGDVNGDGFDDLIIGALLADASENAKSGAGESHLIFGKADWSSSPTIDLANLGSAGVTIFGVAAGDFSGNSVSSAGDVNGDGFDDLLIGAYWADASENAKSSAGDSYVIFGKADWSTTPTIDLASLGAAGITIFGADAGDYSARSVSSAGDVNGDGFDDLFVGAYKADASVNAKSAAGDNYVIFGKADWSTTPTIDLANLGSAGITIFGADANDRSGWSLSGAGDVNGDGFDDLLIGAPLAFASVNAKSYAGESYVIFGKADWSSTPTINLANLGQLGPTVGITIFGADPGDQSGFSVSGAGDVNGDGFDDLLIGARLAYASEDAKSIAGDSYVIFGAASLASTIDLATLGPASITIFGANAGDQSGWSVSSAGDVNGDGFDDLLIGARYADASGNTKSDAGDSYVIFGGNSTATVTHQGTAAANTLTGTSAANIMNGARGDDTLIGSGGADILTGGQGDDILAVSDLTFKRIIGGTGSDTLRLDGANQSLDLTLIRDNRILSIEQIDISGSGNNALTLNRREVLNISDASNTLTVRRNIGDVVNIGSGWTQSTNETIGPDVFNVYTQGAATLKVLSTNRTPTALNLSSNEIAENNLANAVVGTFSSVDPDAGDTFTYSLVTGTGSTDNPSFAISGTQLKANAAFDFETKNSYSIRVRTTDALGLFFEQSFTITVTNVNEAPTALILSSTTIAENNLANAVVGTFSSVDPDAGETFTYSLVAGTGSTDNASFTVTGTQLTANAAFDFETKNSYSIRVRTTDALGLFFEQSFTITVTNVNDAPTALNLSSTTIAENNLANAIVGTFSSIDPDAGDTFTYSLVAGTGSTDNPAFTISGTQLAANSTFDFQTKNRYSIRVRTTDALGLFFEQTFTINVIGVYESTVLADAPKAYYRLGDTPPEQPVSDASGHGLSGTLLNTISLGQSGALTGDSDSAARFNTSGDGVLIADNNLLTPGVAATFEAWIKPDQAANGDYQNLLSKYDYQPSALGMEYELLLNASGRLYFGRGGVALSNVAVASGVWQHVVVTVNNGSVAFYINGIASGGGIVSSGFTNTTAPVQIGTARNTPYQFRGLIDEVATYGTALSPAQILSHYQSAAIGNYSTNVLAANPVAYWRLGDVPPIGDSSGNSLSGTLLNGISLGQEGALARDSDAAARFTTNGDGVLIADNNLLTPGVAATFEAWIKPDQAANGDYQNLLSKYDYQPSALGTEYELLLDASGRLYFGRGGVALSSVAVASGVWQHVVVTVNNGNVAFYINGVASGGGIVSSGFTNTTAPVQIGTARNTSYQFRGLIDEVAIYSSALPIARIQAHYNAGINFAPTNISLSSTVIAENQLAGVSIGTLSSTDLNAEDSFVYSLVSGDGSEDNGSFTVHPTTGVLIANSSFDYEVRNVYSIRIKTTDAGGLAFQKQFAINVTDVNEAPTGVSLQNVISTLPENTSTASRIPVAEIAATDDAQGTNAFSLSGADEASFEIVGTQLFVKAGVTLDFESKTNYSVAVDVDDTTIGGTPDVTVSYILSLADVNEAPVVDDQSYFVAENSSNGTILGNILSSDVDAGDSRSTVVMGGTGAAIFAVNPTNAQITIVNGSAINFEAISSYTLAVMVTDEGGLTDTALITINVTNVNEAPTALNLSSTTIPENNLVNAVVGTFSSIDPDAGDTFTYSLVTGTGSADNAAFTVSGGQLTANTSFDFETKNSYSIRVRTTDVGGLAFEKTFTITVADVDEIAPTISSASFLSSGTVTAGASSLTVTFSEVVAGPTAAANFELRRAGADGLLGNADDSIVAIPAAIYASGTNIATLNFAGLVEDVYRLTVRDAITDSAGINLDGDGNGTAGGNWQRDFVVGLPDSPSTQSLFAAPGQAGARSGYSVAADGNLRVAGAPFADIGSFTDVGAVYVYEATTGALIATLANPTPADSDFFGYSVAVSGNTVVVGTFRDDTGASDSGSAYVFNATTGALISTLANPTPAINDNFGNSVAVSGNTVVVGAFLDDNGAADSGSAYVFNATTGALIATLVNPTPASSDNFGNSVAVSGNTVIVGAFSDNTSATDSGSAYVFNATTGALVATLANPAPANSDNFANSVAVSGITVVVGAYLDDTGATNSGSAYVFNATTGVLISTLANPTPSFQDDFGNSVAVSGNTVVVGAFLDDTGAANSGSAYVFSATTGALISTLANPTPASGDSFGSGVAISGNTIVVGAYQDDTLNSDAGAAYLFPVEINHHRVGPLGTGFSIAGVGLGSAQLVQGTANAFDGLNRLRVSDFDFVTPPSSVSSLDDGGRTVVTPMTVMSNLNVSREVTIPIVGSEDFARTIDVFSNITGSAITVPVKIVGNLGSDAATTVFATSDGDLLVEPTDLWFGTDDADGSGTPAIIHLLHGPSGLQPTNVNVIEDNVQWTYNLTVLAGETTRLAHFTVLGTTRADAVAAANILATTTGFGGQAAAFLTAEERASLANFQFNRAPTDISISNGLIAENAGINAVVGSLSFTDPDAGDTGIFSLPSSIGDNGLFNIALDGTTLRANDIFNFEMANAYSVTVRVTDAGGFFFEKTFAISVTNVNEIPTALSLSLTTISENNLPNAVVGAFSNVDPDAGETFTYSLVSGTGDTDNAAFTVSSTQLTANAAFDFETKNSYSIRVRTTDAGGLFFEQEFTILVSDVAEDLTRPVSAVQPLPTNATSLSIPIAVGGTDPNGPEGSLSSGIKEFDLYVAQDSGAFIKFATVPVSSPTTVFTGTSNHVFYFRSVALDNAGNVELDSTLTADAFIRVGDLDKPVTQVNSATASSAGLFTINVSGTDSGGSRLTQFDLYVSVDGGTPALISSVNSGNANVSGVYNGSATYQGPTDGTSHSYRFFSRGRDSAGNVEDASATGNVTVAATFAAPVSLQGTGIDVQSGAQQRSFVRFVDVLFNSANGVSDLLNPNRIKVEKFALGATSVTAGQGIDVTASATVSQVGNSGRLQLDFGTQGIGGARNTTAGDGFYRIRIDANNDGDYSDVGESFEFYRLLGDANGDRIVDQLDTAVVDRLYGSFGTNLDGDLNGDGVVNASDKNSTLRTFRGRKLADGLAGLLDD